MSETAWLRRTAWARGLLALQSAIAWTGAVLLWPGGGAAAIVAVVAGSVGVLSTLGAWSLPRRPNLGRRAALWLMTLALPLQAVLIGFGIPPVLAVSGLALAAAGIALLRPRFAKLRPRPRKTWLVLHVGFSVSWLGAAMAMLILAIVGATTSDMQLRHYTYEIMHIFDLTIVIPLVLLSLTTGLVVSLGTKWGLIKYRWVLTKFAIALSIPVFAALEENFWVREAVERTGQNRSADLAATDVKLWSCFVVFSLLLWTTTTLSTIKPWGKTRWGQRDANRTAAQRRRRTDNDPAHATT